MKRDFILYTGLEGLREFNLALEQEIEKSFSNNEPQTEILGYYDNTRGTSD